jgi:nitroreductase
MNTLEAIRTRRSIRVYQSKLIPAEVIQEILTAAMYAPSAGDQQPWQFVVVDDPKILTQIPTIHPHAEMAQRAPAAILVCGDTRLEKYAGFWMQDCSAAIQNLLLAAHELGVGSVWTAVYPQEGRVRDFQKMFNLPQQVLPLALVVLGYPAEKPATPQRYQEERVHRNKW